MKALNKLLTAALEVVQGREQVQEELQIILLTEITEEQVMAAGAARVLRV